MLHQLPPGAPAPIAVAAQDCRRGSRDCFPDDLVAPQANRGSGRIWYRVQVCGYEPVYTADGELLSNEFVLDWFNVEVPLTWATAPAMRSSAQPE